MLSLESVTRADFEARLQEVFHLVLHDGSFPLHLAEVRTLGGAAPGGEREPFAVTFHAERAIRLPQGIYRLENEQLGAMELFLVQHSPVEVEAVFN